MKKILFLLAISLVYTELYAQKPKHVLLISIDGFRPEFYLEKGWQTPNLRSLMQEGMYANGINSIFPSVTYPSHTSIITGAFPASHGIFYNAPRDGENGEWYWNSSLIKTKTLWDACKEAGITTGAVMWPVTVGAPINWNFPVRRPNSNEKLTQLSLAKALGTPAGFVDVLIKNGVLSGSQKDLEYPQLDNTIGDISAYIIKRHHPTLMAVHFVGADHYQHGSGRESKQTHKAIALIDKKIGELLQVLEDINLRDNTTIIITGDHGFVDSDKAFSPNILLAKMGLITKEGRQAHFVSTGGSAFLYVKDKKLVPSITKMLNQLPDSQKVFRLIDRKQLDAIGADPSAALALTFNDGVVGKGGNNGELLVDKKGGGSHGHYPDFHDIKTGFIISGGSVSAHKEIEGMGIQDIAPLIADILKLPFKAKDGKLFPNILIK